MQNITYRNTSKAAELFDILAHCWANSLTTMT